MRLWDYLKSHMRKHEKKIAFATSKLSYADILSFPENALQNKKLVLCERTTLEEQAITLIQCIASGNVAVPVDKANGEVFYRRIKEIVNKEACDIQDLSFLMFTGGTTGTPKGVMLTEDNIISNLEYINTYFRLENIKRICIARPLIHIAVLTGELLYALCNGLTIYFYEEPFVPKRLYSYLFDNKIDVFGATPTIYSLLVSVKTDKKFTVKVGVISGEILTRKTVKKIIGTFPDTKFYNVYGLTEHSPRVSALLPQDFAVRLNSVGKVLGDIKAKIVDGELWVKSPSVMKGYYKNHTLTKEKIVRGWLKTGDLAHFDENGYLYIDGRKDNMIIRAGINIYPEEIESVAEECQGVETCLVFGENTEFGTVIRLKYTGSAKTEELRRFLLKKLNPHIVPTIIEKTTEIARSASGKKIRRWKQKL